MSVAVNAITGSVRVVAVAGIVMAVTVGRVVSGRVMATVAGSAAEMFPAASRVKAYSVLKP